MLLVSLKLLNVSMFCLCIRRVSVNSQVYSGIVRCSLNMNKLPYCQESKRSEVEDLRLVSGVDVMAFMWMWVDTKRRRLGGKNDTALCATMV